MTHRLASAAQADHIFVLDRGVLVEQGNHDALMAAGGLYARLYDEQYGAQQAGVTPTLQANRLRRVPLFADLPLEALTAIAAHLTPERFAEGDTIVQQGDVGDKLYLIERGRVEVTVPGPTGTACSTRSTTATTSARSPCCSTCRVRRRAGAGAVQPAGAEQGRLPTLVERLPQVAEQLARLSRSGWRRSRSSRRSRAPPEPRGPQTGQQRLAKPLPRSSGTQRLRHTASAARERSKYTCL